MTRLALSELQSFHRYTSLIPAKLKMDSLLINQEFEDPVSVSLSAAELEDLVTTNFVIPLQNLQNEVRSSD